MERARFLRLLFFSPWKQQYQADIALGPAVINEASAGPEIARRCFRQDGFGSAPERRACALSRSPRRPCGRALACCLREPLAGRCTAAGPLPAPGACGGPQEPACEGEWTPGRARPASTPPRFSGNGSGCHDLSSWRALRGSGKLKRAEPCAHPPGVKSLLSRISLSSSPAPHHLAAVSGAFTLVHTGHGIFTATELSWTPHTQKMHFACRRLGWKYSSS